MTPSLPIVRSSARIVITLLLAAAVAGPAIAGSIPVEVDLVQRTANPGLEYSLLVGSVVMSGHPTDHVAVCLAAYKVGKVMTPVGRPELVAFAEAGDKGIVSITSVGGSCQGQDCTAVELLVNDHNLGLDSFAAGLVCADPAKLARRFGLDQVPLDDLTAVDGVSLDLEVGNVFDDSVMGLALGHLGQRQTCRVPSTDQDVRYGSGLVRDPTVLGGVVYRSTGELFVCSEGVRVCSFSQGYMEGIFNQATIRGNDLDNTIMLSASPDVTMDGHPRYCRTASGGSSTPPYKVYGWRSTWMAQMRLYGLDGHDWLAGSPNPDLIYGGDGDDMLRGLGGGANRLYGEGGHDIMHDAPTGVCDGGSPEPNLPCFTDPWVWPPAPYPAGDCCCHSCTDARGCFSSDATPGVELVPPDPW